MIVAASQHSTTASLLDQSEELHGGSVAKASTCRCLVVATSTLCPSARGRDEHDLEFVATSQHSTTAAINLLDLSEELHGGSGGFGGSGTPDGRLKYWHESCRG